MSEPVAGMSFHAFCEHFAQELYDHVRLPSGEDEDKVVEDFHQLGFTGAAGSTDVTHVKWDCFPHSEQRLHTGKEGYPSIVYQATVDNSGRVLAVTTGFPGSFHDKMIIRFDSAVTKMKNDSVYKNRVFHPTAADGTTVECKGNYLLIDNGYHEVNITESGGNMSVPVTVIPFFVLPRAVGRVLAYCISLENVRQKGSFPSNSICI